METKTFEHLIGYTSNWNTFSYLLAVLTGCGRILQVKSKCKALATTPQTNMSGFCLCVKRGTHDECTHLLIHAFVPSILQAYKKTVEGIL
jgi:hypothetical protein